MIHLVVALPAEAAPLVGCFGLRRETVDDGTRLYVGERARLVVSGVGKAAASTAAGELNRRHEEAGALWVNVGIGAHRRLPIGRLVIAGEIVEATGERTCQPRSTGSPGIPTVTVCTVDRFQQSIEDDRLYEMEAVGFAHSVLRWAPAERVVCLKVVSDRGVDSPGALSRQRVSDLVRGALGEIERVLMALD